MTKKEMIHELEQVKYRMQAEQLYSGKPSQGLDEALGKIVKVIEELKEKSK